VLKVGSMWEALSIGACRTANKLVLLLVGLLLVLELLLLQLILLLLVMLLLVKVVVVARWWVVRGLWNCIVVVRLWFGGGIVGSG